MTPKKPKKKDKETELTLMDRLVTAFLGGLFALITGSIIWAIAFLTVYRITMRAGGTLLPFWPVLLFGAGMSATSFFLGPDRMVSFFGSVWKTTLDVTQYIFWDLWWGGRGRRR